MWDEKLFPTRYYSQKRIFSTVLNCTMWMNKINPTEYYSQQNFPLENGRGNTNRIGLSKKIKFPIFQSDKIYINFIIAIFYVVIYWLYKFFRLLLSDNFTYFHVIFELRKSHKIVNNLLAMAAQYKPTENPFFTRFSL